MTPEEKFTFDLEGYLVIKNVLNEEELETLNAIADRVYEGQPYEESGVRRSSRVSLWGEAAKDLIDHPNITSYLAELLGPKFRLDHDYCIFMKKGARRGRLHGGDTDHLTNRAADHWYRYRDGVMRNGLTVFTYALTPAHKGDGGFCCIPGSHKSNFPLNVPGEVRDFERIPHYVLQPELDAGDVLIFTEAVIHGTMPWTADQERRALLFKYSPGHSAWSQNYYDLNQYPNLTDQQRRIMAPPSVGNRPDSLDEVPERIAS